MPGPATTEDHDPIAERELLLRGNQIADAYGVQDVFLARAVSIGGGFFKWR
jgi:hypothetical protein